MYKPVPPAGVTVAVPLQVPKQVAAVPVVVLVSKVGSVTVKPFVLVQPLASVTVTLTAPAHKPVAAAVVCEPGSLHK